MCATISDMPAASAGSSAESSAGPLTVSPAGPPSGAAGSGAAGSIRARVRAEMIDEIKATARRHLASEGANLSLRAVARDMGMVSSALYRYFASRDELLTALIIDAYNALGDIAESADASVTDRADLRGRWLAICHGVRSWALANPAEYALVFGSPVPGYSAPSDTIAAATRTPAALIRVLDDGSTGGTLRATTADPLPDLVRDTLTRVREMIAPTLPEATLAHAMLGWTQLFGAVSFELFGQLNNTVEVRDAYFDHQMRQITHLIGL